MAAMLKRKTGMIGLLLGVVLVAWAAAGPGMARPLRVDDPYYRSSGSWGQDYDDQWALKRIGFTPPGTGESAWDLIDADRLSPVIVAVLDTGLDYFHPDLAPGNIWRNPGETENGRDDDGNGYVDDLIGWNFVDDDNNPWDLAGHGTITAGLIGAAIGNGEGIAGINPAVRIMPLKVLNFQGQGRTFQVARAVYYAVDHGARVINLSLGGAELSRVAREAVAHAVEQGVIVVVAAGNEGMDTAEYGLAQLPEVVVVAATGRDDGRAGFSNWGDEVKIAAPGLDILSLRARQTDLDRVAGVKGYTPGHGFVGPGAGYYRTSGTSFAAPLVSGVASLILARRPDLTGDQVTRMLYQSARDVEETGFDVKTGYGLLDARAALASDPDFYALARIDSVGAARSGGRVVIQVKGSADSSEFVRAWVELGYGEEPAEWERVGDVIRRPVAGGLLAEFGTRVFSRKGKWTVRLILETENHGRSEAREGLDIQ